jgi:hypothetical protein
MNFNKTTHLPDPLGIFDIESLSILLNNNVAFDVELDVELGLSAGSKVFKCPPPILIGIKIASPIIINGINIFNLMKRFITQLCLNI